MVARWAQARFARCGPAPGTLAAQRPMAHNAAMPGALHVRWAAGLAAVAVWAAIVPWLAEAVGLGLDVPTRLEVADHVVPGVVTLVAVALLAVLGGGSASMVWLGVGSVAFLAGLWSTATHVPLLLEAVEGRTPWGVALLHFSAGPPILVLGLWMVVRGLREAPGAP